MFLVFIFLNIFILVLLVGRGSLWVRSKQHPILNNPLYRKFASFYIKREFYFDVHPPLGKMLLGLSGVMVGYNGSFAFESGVKYPVEVFCALFGAFMVPLAYTTGVELKFSQPASIFLSVMVLLDISLLVISRFILLDSMLLFFTCLSVYCLCSFRNRQIEGQFTASWFLWLALTGASLGAVARYFLPSFSHFESSGEGDAQMSSIFQAGLEGNTFHENPIDVAYGSKVSLKNNGHGGGLLHSHIQTYPSGSEQQQITCYHHKDSNNDWIITKPWGAEEEEEVEEDVEVIELLKDGDIIRLGMYRFSSLTHATFKAPVSPLDYEVSCYGNSTLGDVNDHWKVEIVDDLYDKAPEHVKALTSRFRLRHVVTGCLLRSGGATLPQWGFKQAEVSCQVNGKNNSDHNIWNVEQHVNEKLPPGGAKAFQSTFLKNFVDLNVAMWTSNNALTPDPDKEPDQLTSSPYEWPASGLKVSECFFLIGHPLIWWGSAGSFVVFGLIALVYAVRHQRKCHDWTAEGCWVWLVFPLLPFWIMGRVTYLHHYFPALYFGMIMLTLIWTK
ncbi:MIR motif-containing protein [Chytridium lagenaria]|nr:MIR motif-containing protein [Chytridium lagenaria]